MTTYTVTDSNCGLIMATSKKGRAIMVAAINACENGATTAQTDTKMLEIRVAMLQSKQIDGGMTFIQGADSELTIEVWND